VVDPRQFAVGDIGPPREEAELVERDARMHADRERLGRDLEIEKPLIPRADLVEARCLIGDDAGEDVEAACRALGVRPATHVRREVE